MWTSTLLAVEMQLQISQKEGREGGEQGKVMERHMG